MSVANSLSGRSLRWAVVASLLAACGPAETPLVPGPRLALRESVIAFGTKFDDESVDASLWLKNVGLETLHVNRIDANCGCLRLGDPPTDIASGHEVELKLRIRLTGMAGPLQRGIAIDTNDPKTPIVRVRIEGEVRPRLEVTPTLVEVRPATLDAASTVKLDVVSATGQPLDQMTVSCTIPGVAVQAERDGSSAHVLLAVPSFADDLQGAVVLALGESERIIPFNLFAALDVRAEPSRLVAGNGNRGEALEARLVGRPGVAWRVRAVETDRKELTGEVVNGVLRVRIVKGAPAGPFAGVVTVLLDGAKPDRVRVPVTAYVSE